MKYGYIRVSTKKQVDGNSLEAQEKAVLKAGAEEIFKDVFTGSKIDRPELKKLIQKLQKGDTLICTKLDRLARSTGQASSLITELLDRGIRIEILNLGTLENSSMNALLRNILLAFSEFEREMIRERTQEGKAIARQKPGYREGRPKKYRREQIEHALGLLDNYSYNQVEKITGISKSTLYRAKKAKLSSME